MDDLFLLLAYCVGFASLAVLGCVFELVMDWWDSFCRHDIEIIHTDNCGYIKRCKKCRETFMYHI